MPIWPDPFISVQISSGGKGGQTAPRPTAVLNARIDDGGSPISWFNNRAEEQIAKARAAGQLDHLPGEGKPLPDRTGDAFITQGDAIGFRIMAEAGALPEEIVWKKPAATQRALLATLTDSSARKAAMAELAAIEMRQAIAEDSRRKFLKI